MADGLSKKLPPWAADIPWPTPIPEKDRLRLKLEPVLESYQPTSRDRMVGLMADYLYGGGKQGYQRANNAMNILDWTPVGTLNDTYDAGRAIGEGLYGDAALMAGLAILPGRSEHLVKKFGRGLPGKSLFGSKSKPQSDLAQDHLLDKELASKLPISYAPKSKPQRGFKEDYPNGAAQDETGRLLEDIEGRELTAPNIIGRRMVGEPDSPAAPAQIRSVGEELVSQGIETVASGDIRGGAGLATFDRHLRAPLSIKTFEQTLASAGGANASSRSRTRH